MIVLISDNPLEIEIFSFKFRFMLINMTSYTRSVQHKRSKIVRDC